MCQQDAQQRAMLQDVWTPMITSDHSLRNKSMRARNKVAHVELLRGLVPRYAVTVIQRNQQRKKQRFFCPPKKRAKPKTKKITTTFGTSLFLIKCRMRYAIYMPPNTKDLTINHTMVAYGNRQNATAFARANSDLLRSLKHLMKTRLNSTIATIWYRLLTWWRSGGLSYRSNRSSTFTSCCRNSYSILSVSRQPSHQVICLFSFADFTFRFSRPRDADSVV